MKRFVALFTAILAVVSFSGSAMAQGSTWIFKSPVFVFQPGFVVTNFIDKAEVDGQEVNNGDTETDFLFRVVTAIPTTIPRTTLVGIVQWTPFNKAEGSDFNNNAPSFVYGPVFNLFSTDMLALDFDILGAYGGAGRSSDNSAYTHKLVLEADLFIKLGNMMMKDDPDSRFKNLSLYAFLAYVATGLEDGNVDGSEIKPSRFVLLTGLSLPIAP
ncbi:MAG: hypothetical protein ABR543_16960 [Gemmatimonadaceae bacterium]